MNEAVVSHARSLLDDLVKAEWRGNGDVKPALRRIARREGVSFAALWALRYRPPKDVYASLLIKLIAAHEAMCDTQRKRYQTLRTATDRAMPVAAALSRVAAAIAGEDYQQN